MKRRYSRKMALENIRRIKEAFPRVTFTTDIMVGFPGESDEDFLDSVSFVREVGFLDAHVFAYSKRKNTPAEKYPDQVPEDLKRKRSEELIRVVAEVREKTLSDIARSGRDLPTVFETLEGEWWQGHSDNFATVRVKCEKDIHGERFLVKPIEVRDDVIYGEII